MPSVLTVHLYLSDCQSPQFWHCIFTTLAVVPHDFDSILYITDCRSLLFWHCIVILLNVVVQFLCNRVYCIHVPGHDPLILSFRSFSFLIGFMAQLSKVLKVVCWAGSVPFPPVSLQKQVVCLLLRPMFVCSSQGRAYTVSWLVGVQIKVML